MKEYCLNYKLPILLIFPIVGIVFSVVFLLSNAAIYIGLTILGLSLLTTIILLIIEPVFYIINSETIIIKNIFNNNCLQWKNVKNICVMYDPFFEILFIKDFNLIVDKPSKSSKRFLRIVKSKKTTEIIHRYASIYGINIIKY